MTRVWRVVSPKVAKYCSQVQFLSSPRTYRPMENAKSCLNGISDFKFVYAQHHSPDILCAIPRIAVAD